jgi:Tfp pilus assembly protein PilO
MQQHRIISLLSILVMLIIPVIGWFLVAQPQLAAAASADQQRVEAAAQVAMTQAVVEQLKVDAENLPELVDELDDLRRSIPAGVDPSGYIDGLSALAKISGVKITALTVLDPLAYSPASPPADANAPAPEEPAEGEAAAEEGAAGETPTETPAAPVDFPGIVTNPLIDSSNFVAIPVTIEVAGSQSAFLKFVNGLQSNNRLFLVFGLSTEQAAEPGSKGIVGKVGGFIYAIPTGVPGDPHPVSTMVKQMESDEPVAPVTPDPGTTGTPTPNPTDTPAP